MTLANPAGILAEVTPGDASTYTVVVAQTDGNNLVSFKAPSQAVTPWTSGQSCGGGQGFLDGPCANAQFHGVQGVAWKDPNTLFVADTLNNRVRQVTWARHMQHRVPQAVFVVATRKREFESDVVSLASMRAHTTCACRMRPQQRRQHPWQKAVRHFAAWRVPASWRTLSTLKDFGLLGGQAESGLAARRYIMRKCSSASARSRCKDFARKVVGRVPLA